MSYTPDTPKKEEVQPEDKAQELRLMKERLEQMESTKIPGATTLTPKQALLDASEVEKEHPDKHIRWVNVGSKEKAQSRVTEGYRLLDANQGGRSLGDELALMHIPKQLYDEKVARIKHETERRRKAHKDEVHRAVEGVARELRDRHDINIDVDRLMVDE